MNPVNFPESNLTLLPPPGMPECVALHVRRENGVIMSQWELSAAELAQLIVSRRIVLYVHSGDTAPPVAMAVLYPIRCGFFIF